MSAIAINVVQAGTPEVFDMLVLPEQHPSTYQYITNQFQNISTTLMDSGRKFIEDSKALYEKFYDSSIERAARAAVRMARNLSNPNLIQQLDGVEDIQCASPVMQRYIMAEPTIREKFQNQQCSGYAGSYLDMDPGYIKLDHYDWRRVMNGIVRFEGEGKDERWISTTYFEELREGDRELEFEEKIDILNTWDNVKETIIKGDDPTCPFGSKIG